MNAIINAFDLMKAFQIMQLVWSFLITLSRFEPSRPALAIQAYGIKH